MRVKCLLIITVVLLLSAGLAFGQSVKQMSVTVKETQVRATPSYMGKILAVLVYGERVDVLAEQRGWARVRLPSGQGWVNLSALTAKQIVMQSGSQNVGTGASSGEVALAGKASTRRWKTSTRRTTTWTTPGWTLWAATPLHRSRCSPF